MDPEQEEALQREMRSLSRHQTHHLWEIIQIGGEIFLSEEEALQAQVMKEHPEYYDVWERADEIDDEELVIKGVNPFLHITMHTIIENQVREGTPPEVAKIIKARLHRGADRHEVIHEIAYVFTHYLWEVLKHHRPFDEEGYVRELKALARPYRRERRSRHRRRS